MGTLERWNSSGGRVKVKWRPLPDKSRTSTVPIPASKFVLLGQNGVRGHVAPPHG